MVYIFQIASVLCLVLSCNAYADSNCEFCPPDEDTVLLHVGSQLRSLGKVRQFGSFVSWIISKQMNVITE